MRVALSKAEEQSKEQSADIVKIYKRVIDKLANDEACIGLIPMKSNKYEIQVAYSSGHPENRKYTTLEEYYSQMALNGLFLSNSFGNSGQLNDGVTVGKTIPGKEIGIIDVPDEYTIMQRIAKEKGLENGTYIDYFTGQEIDNCKSKNSEEQVKDEGTFLEKIVKQANIATRTGVINSVAKNIKLWFKDKIKYKKKKTSNQYPS